MKKPKKKNLDQLVKARIKSWQRRWTELTKDKDGAESAGIYLLCLTQLQRDLESSADDRV